MHYTNLHQWHPSFLSFSSFSSSSLSPPPPLPPLIPPPLATTAVHSQPSPISNSTTPNSSTMWLMKPPLVASPRAQFFLSHSTLSPNAAAILTPRTAPPAFTPPPLPSPNSALPIPSTAVSGSITAL